MTAPRNPDDDWKPLMSFLTRHGDAIWRLVQVGFFVALLFAKSQFVPRDEFEAAQREQKALTEKLSGQITELTTELRIQRERRNDDAAQNERLADHETRLRHLERK